MVFSAPEESPTHALDLAESSIALVDCDHSAACTAEFLRAAAGRGVRVVLFSPGRRDYEVGDIARRHGLDYFSMPITRAELSELLVGAPPGAGNSVPGSRPRAVRADAERRASSALRDLVYRDPSGRAWHVYDRRSGADRRAGASPAQAEAGHRAFVADNGDERHFQLGPDDIERTTAEELARQFALAVRPPA